MFRKILKICGIVLIVGFVSAGIYGYKYQVQKSQEKDVNNISSEKQEIIDEDTISTILDNNIKEEKVESDKQETTTSKKDKENNNTNNTSDVKVKEEKQTETKANSTTKDTQDNQKVETKQETTTKVETNKNDDKVVNNESSSSNEIVEEKKELTEWEKLGITEYEYYNTSDIAWKTLDFSVKEYGSMESAFAACRYAGENYTGMENYRFRCDDVKNYAGYFIGYHIEYIALES